MKTSDLIGPALAALLVSGCITLPHTVEHQLVAGRVLAIHTDHPADPCPPTAAGCYARESHEVFLRSPVFGHTRSHEVAHAEGMVHGPWLPYYVPALRYCAVVVMPGGKYKIGDAICVSSRGEEILPASLILEN